MIKRTMILLSVLAAGTLLFTGCAQNPTEDAVVNKNEGVFEKAVHGKNSSVQNQDIPETYEDYFETDSGDWTISVAADVKAANTKLPVVRVTPHEVTSGEVKHWADILFEGKTAYDAVQALTKTDIEQKILELKQWMNDRDALMAEYGSETEVEKIVEYYKSEIAMWEKQYEKAPDESERQICDWEFRPAGYYMQENGFDENGEDADFINKTKDLQCITELNGYRAMLSASNRNESDFLTHRLWFYYDYDRDYEFGLEGVPYQNVDADEAKSMAEDIIEKLDLGQWSLVYSADQSTQDKSWHNLEYAPVYEKIPMAAAAGIDLRSEDMYAANYYYSKLEITIINGIFESILLTSPLDVEEVINEDVETLPFEDIYQSFKNHARAKFSAKSMENSGISGGFRITNIEQKLFRVREKDSDGGFLLVPVWVFSEQYDVLNSYPQNWVIVNAVDGSIINENLGY